MEFQYKGANCLVITTKKAKLVIDDNLTDLGQPSASAKSDIHVFTSHMIKKNQDKTVEGFVIDGPGEYEISEVSVKGIAARANMDEEGKHTATVYRIAVGTTMIAVLGHIYPKLSDKQLESIGMIDILVIPIGGNGYTIDAKGAQNIIKEIEPKMVILTHYDQKGFNYEVPQASIDDFIRETSITPEKIDKIKIKNDIFPDNMVVYQMEIS